MALHLLKNLSKTEHKKVLSDRKKTVPGPLPFGFCFVLPKEVQEEPRAKKRKQDKELESPLGRGMGKPRRVAPALLRTSICFEVF